MRLGGGFVLSDDSHGVDQVATNYARVLPFLEQTGITHLFAMQQTPTRFEGEKPRFEFVQHELKTVKSMQFWKNA